MIIARKKDDRVVVGSFMLDSFINMSEKDLFLAENVPCWKVKGVKNCYVFAEDLTFSTDLLRHNDSVFKDITDGNSVITNVVPKMKKLLAEHSCIIDNKRWDSQLLIVKDNKMFTIGPYFMVSEPEEFVALGCEPYLLGGLRETQDLPAEESILFSVRTVNRMRSKNLFPLVLFDGKTEKRKVIHN